MDPELEGLIRALDMVREARNKTDYLRCRAMYELRLDGVIARRPGLTRQTLDKAITIAYRRWLAAQNRPSTLPPSA
jgi:hypothetical protein